MVLGVLLVVVLGSLRLALHTPPHRASSAIPTQTAATSFGEAAFDALLNEEASSAPPAGRWRDEPAAEPYTGAPSEALQRFLAARSRPPPPLARCLASRGPWAARPTGKWAPALQRGRAGGGGPDAAADAACDVFDVAPVRTSCLRPFSSLLHTAVPMGAPNAAGALRARGTPVRDVPPP